MGYVAKFNPVRHRVEVLHEVTGERFSLRLEDPHFASDALEELGVQECRELTLEAVADCLTLGSDIRWDDYAAKRKGPFEL